MGRHRKNKRWGMPDDYREPLGARLSLLLLLSIVFIWTGLRGTDILVVTLLSTVVSCLGLVIGYRAFRKIRHGGGRIPGETMARIAYYGNLVAFLLSFLMFSYAMAIGILRGDLL